MFGTDRDKLPQEIFLLLIPSFSMMAFTATVEPLRAANRMSGKPLYAWRTLSRDGQPVVQITVPAPGMPCPRPSDAPSRAAAASAVSAVHGPRRDDSLW